MLGLRSAIFPVTDLPAARQWYANLLGYDPYFDQPFYVGFEVGGYELGLLPSDGTWNPSADGQETLFGVDDIHETYERLLSAGATEIEAPRNVGGDLMTAAVRTPQGNRFGIIYNPEFRVPSVSATIVADSPNRLAAASGELAAKQIVVERELDAEREKVWQAWSSAEGLKAWFASEVRMELRIGGPFEILFLPESEPQRGSERSRVLSFIPGRMISFTWNAPPQFELTRNQNTWVVVELEGAEQRTRVRITHTGWPAAGFDAAADSPSARQWVETFAYFENAWPRVLESLAAHLESL